MDVQLERLANSWNKRSRMPSNQSTSKPSAQLLVNLRRELAAHAPFTQMLNPHVEEFAACSRLAYFSPEELILEPASGAVSHLYWVQQGGVVAHKGLADTAGGFHYEAGDLFPVGAALGQRPVTATYRADGDTFCLMLPVEDMNRLATQSAAFADFLNRRVAQFLELSRRALQASFASQSLTEQSLEASLGSMPRKKPVTVGPDDSLQLALSLMHERRIGSILVTRDAGEPLGILTRHDVLGRVTLPQVSLDSPISKVMSAPVQGLTTEHTAQDAVLLMSRKGIRHVPVLEGGIVVSIISERDLFALQRLSLKQVSTRIRTAADLPALKECAANIRELTRQLMGQGVQARQLTELISHLNDLLAEHLVQQVAAKHGLDIGKACWLAFGSEGRGEQTISTDQDNGLIFACEPSELEASRQAWLEMAREVNLGLDACGYPLCKGQIMASNPACCLTQQEWLARFDHWMEQGAPEDLLNASIYFDLRPVAGASALAGQLREHITEKARSLPRFMKQLALNALTRRPPLSWRGSIDTHEREGKEVIDAKLQGTAIYVDAARIYALAHGIAETGTRARLLAAAQALKLEARESEAWVAGFEFLQAMRLRVQIDMAGRSEQATHANLIEVDALNDIDRRILREALGQAQKLQQRLELDYQR
jgi:CBS domain-containing protein